MLFRSDPVSSLQRPHKELKDFTKVALAPGQSKEVRFTLDARDFSFFDPQRARWIAESGEFQISLGASSADIRLEDSVQLHTTQALNYAFDKFTFFRVLWEDEQTKPLLIELIPRWLGTWTEEGKPLNEANVHPYLLDQPLAKLP